MPEQTGQLIDRYQMIELLEQDQTASVYKAYDPKFERPVTIYLLTQTDSTVPGILKNVRTISSWNHAGLPRIFDFGTYQDKDYIVQEFIPGASLQKIEQAMRKADCWLGLHESVLMIKEISAALEYIHQRGMVHGDLHPGTIAFKPEQSTSLPYQPVITRTGFGGGQAPSGYRSPEVVRAGRIEKYADLFSIGAVLYELVTGQPPTPQGEAASGPAQVLSPHLLNPELPEALEKLILKSLSPNPADRFQSAQEYAAALAQIQDQVFGKQSPPSGIGKVCQILSFMKLENDQRLSNENRPENGPASSGAVFSSTSEPPQDIIYVLMPDKSIRSFPFKPGGMMIGRSKENDIPLDLPGVSRHHTRIDFDGQNYIIRDLNSLNGTYLDQDRLPPEKPQVWLPGENLRVGEAWFRIERQAQTRTTQAVISRDLPTRPGKSLPETDEIFVGPNGERIESSQVLRSAGLGWVGAYTPSLSLSVAPGSSLEIPLLLLNRGPANDSYQIKFQGIPLEWIPNPPHPVRIPANGQREIRLTIRPPRSPLVKAGRYPLTIKVTSQNSTSQVVDLRLTLTVTAFSLFASELRPSTIPPGENGQVYIHNRGNLPETFTIVWEDRSHTLVFEPPQVKVNLQVGKSAVVEFRPSLLKPRLVGADTPHPFKVNISSQGGQVETLQAEFISRGLIPSWAPIALALLSILLACVLCLVVNQITFPVRMADQTAQAVRTEHARASETAIFMRTATSQTLEGANLATLQAATATAAWLVLDDDQDGLTNSMEITAGTLPNVADTDEDGLTDGEEVLTWKTNPLLADTDGDGLKDGVEVERGTNPLLRDTDGDGIDDAADPQPLVAATRTPLIYLPTATSPPFFTPTPTRTHTPTPSATPRTVDLSISISNGQSSSIPGTNTIYTIVVTNRGPAAVTNTSVIDQFPSTLLNITWTCDASPGARCLTTNGTGNINALLDLAPGSTVTLTANGRIAPGATGVLTNTARVVTPADLTETNPTDNQATDADDLIPRAALSLSKTDAKDTILPGQNTSYTIIVFNNGPSTVNGIRVRDTFPAQLNNIAWTCGATGGSSCAVSGTQTGDINHLISLSPGGSATFNVSANVRNNASGVIANTVTLESPIDPATNNKSVTDNTSVIPQVDLELDVTAPISVTVSSPLTYTLTVTNTGPSTASGIVLTSTLPLTATFTASIPDAPDCQVDSNVLVCDLGSLPAGGSAQVQIIAGAPAVTGPFTTLTEVRANEEDPDPTDNQADTTVTAY